MTFYVILVVLFLLCLYVGQVLGLLIHCENCGYFKGAKRYVHLVPILKVGILVPCVKDCIKEKSIKWLIAYLLTSDKNILIMCGIVELLPELERAKVKKERKKPVRISKVRTICSMLLETQYIMPFCMQMN